MAKLIRVWDGSAWQTVGTASAVGATGATGPAGATGPTGATGAAGPSAETLLSTTSLSGASTTISSISQAYTHLKIVVSGITNDTAAGYNLIKPNGTSSICSYANVIIGPDFSGSVFDPTGGVLVDFRINSRRTTENANDNNFCEVVIKNYSSSSLYKAITGVSNYKPVSFGYMAEEKIGAFHTATAFTSLVFSNTAGSHTSGTVKLYGLN